MPSQLPWAIRPNIRLRNTVPMIMLALVIGCGWCAMFQGQKRVPPLGKRRVASTRFPRNKMKKIIAAEKKISTRLFIIVA